jgi:Cdc37 Hsp90 binding domain
VDIPPSRASDSRHLIGTGSQWSRREGDSDGCARHPFDWDPTVSTEPDRHYGLSSGDPAKSRHAERDPNPVSNAPANRGNWSSHGGYQPSSSLPSVVPGRASGDINVQVDSRPQVSHLSQLGQQFASIRVGEVKACVTFIIADQKVLGEDPQQYLREAGILYRKGKVQDARACVQQALIIDHCSGLDNEDIKDYLKDLAEVRKSTVNKLLSNVDKTFAAVKDKSDASETSESNAVPYKPTSEQRRHTVPERLPEPVGPIHSQSFSSPIPSDLVDKFAALDVATSEALPILGPVSLEPSRTQRHRATTLSTASQSGAGHEGSRNSILPENIGVRGTEGEFEPLDPQYRRRRDPADFFAVGRLFAILWHENMGITNKKPGPEVKFTRDNRYGEKIFSHIRRMIVVRQRYGYCWCVAINTYGGQGLVGKHRSDAEVSSHTIVHDRTKKPAVFEREKGLMNKEPIAIDMTGHHTLHPASRLNYAKVSTVEHNVKVMDIGMVCPTSMPYFLSHWQNEMSN